MAISSNLEIAKISCGTLQIAKISIGKTLIYSAGNTVTYCVDTSVIYQEEVDADDIVLSPTSFAPAKAGWEFVGWRQDTVASGDVLSSLNMEDDHITLYAVFRQAVTVTYYNGSTTKQTSTGYRYYNNTNVTNPAFTIVQATLSGWTARGWSIGTTGNAAISYTSLNNTAISSSTTLYGMYQQTITLTVYNGGATTASKPTGIRYYNSGSNSIVNPKFNIAATSLSGFTFRGWTTTTDASAKATIAYSSISNREFSAAATVYAAYYQTITLTFNASGGSGTTNALTDTRYYNGFGAWNPMFKLPSSGFNRANYTFGGWLLDNKGSTYAVGASYTATANATFYAKWVGVAYDIRSAYTCEWTFVSGTEGANLNYGGNNFYISKGSGAAVYKTQSFDTRGLSTLTVKMANCDMVTVYIKGSKILYTLDNSNTGSNPSFTVDISGQSSIYIQVNFSGNGMGYANFSTLKIS